MSRIEFADLVQALPAGLPTPQDRRALVDGERARSFVPPNFQVRRAVDQPAVILVSAPAAAGKSTTAKALAGALRTPYWDTSSMHVGNHSFVGTLATAYEDVGAVRSALTGGRGLLVIDALDEAHTRSGGTNFDAFLSDLAETVKTATSPCLVMFGRVKTIEWVQIVLEDAGVECNEYRIDFFDRNQARTFLDLHLDARREADGRPAAHRQHQSVYDFARDSLLDLMTELLATEPMTDEDPWTQEQVRSFLGYAPVLESLAVILDLPNPKLAQNSVAELRRELRQPGTAGHGRVILDIVRHLVKREQKKVVAVLEPTLRSSLGGQDLPEDLFGMEEQILRCIRDGVNVELDIPRQFSASLQREYEDRVRDQVDQHPFRGEGGFSSTVFLEFCAAWLMTSSLATATSKFIDKLAGSRYQPTHLLGRCVAALCEELQEATSIAGDAFGLLYESAVTPVLDSSEPFLELLERDHYRAEAEFMAPDGEGRPVATLCVEVRLGAGALRFWRTLRNAVVMVRDTVELGFPGEGFALGPVVILQAERLRCLAGSVDITAREEGMVHLLALESAETTPATVLTTRGSRDESSISWPSPKHPWVSLHRETPRPDVEMAPERWWALRKLVLMFARQRTRRIDTVRGSRWGQDELWLRDLLLRLALEHGVLSEDGEYFIFNNAFRPLTEMLDGSLRMEGEAGAFVRAYAVHPG